MTQPALFDPRETHRARLAELDQLTRHLTTGTDRLTRQLADVLRQDRQWTDRHRRRARAATIAQALVLAGLLLTLTGLPTSPPAGDGPDTWWRDATTAEQAAHAVEQQRDSEAAIAITWPDQARG